MLEPLRLKAYLFAMKLRVLDNTLRFRLSQSEVARLIEGNTIRASVVFPGSNALHYAIAVNADDAAATASFDQAHITIGMPCSHVATFSSDDVVTLNATVGTPSSLLEIKIEKDFQCLAPRDEDESDLYAHPKSSAC